MSKFNGRKRGLMTMTEHPVSTENGNTAALTNLAMR